ncbi:MAG: HEPN domain-containing protein [Chloroflexi bacterium]|nr:HEPN domain-containing protein [Chloroflexota bacterium]
MSPDVFDKQALIHYRLEQALHKQARTPASIVNRAYYAMFYATLALLATIDSDSSKHSSVIALFDKNFVRQKILPKEMSVMLHEAFESRQEGDYRDFSKIDRNKATELLRSAEEFIRSIEEKLSEYL